MENAADEPIELLFPADPRLVRVARLVASGVATTAGFDVEEVEDLRIAVDEVCAALLEGGSGRRLRLQFNVDDNEVRVIGSTPASSGGSFEDERLKLSRQILAVVVDEHSIEADHGEVHVRLRKRRSEDAVGA